MELLHFLEQQKVRNELESWADSNVFRLTYTVLEQFILEHDIRYPFFFPLPDVRSILSNTVLSIVI